MRTAQPFISVILPSYNEFKNLKRGVLGQIYSYLSKQSYSWELVLTDDGSTDGTAQKLEQFATMHQHVLFISGEHQGKGPTVSAGMLAAHGENRLFTDFDQATPIGELEKLLPFVNKGYQIVIGSREAEGAKREKEPLYRHIMGKTFNFFVSLFTIRGIHDTQCGFKLFTKEAVEFLFPALKIYSSGKKRSDAFTGAFDVELLYLGRKKGMSIVEVPVHWRHIKTDRVNPVKDSIRMFFDLLRIRFADVLGEYSNI